MSDNLTPEDVEALQYGKRIMKLSKASRFLIENLIMHLEMLERSAAELGATRVVPRDRVTS